MWFPSASASARMMILPYRNREILEVLPEPAAERGHQIGKLLVFQHLGQRRALHVQHLAAQRQNPLAADGRGPAWLSHPPSLPRR